MRSVTALPTAMLLLSLVLFAACGKKTTAPLAPSGARSAIFVADTLSIEGAQTHIIRKSSTLGLFVTEYLSTAPVYTAVQGATDAVLIQSTIFDADANVGEPDFALLQAFQDALQVDVQDLLNRSDSREQSLDAYSEALTNIATRANDRFRQLTSVQDELKNLVRTLNKEKNNADRAVKLALKNKEYDTASEAQKILTEKSEAYAEANLKEKQVTDIADTLDELLTLYGEKILAIQQNREVLISGLKVVDVPGIDELQIIKRQKKSSGSRSRSSFDTLFNAEGL